ncbi:hypothetical protein QBC38DRAFT_175641 [Podospora fimiseda]|uniref:NACHT domain-containing protein n=1 Tax=Podospora fimiseda TaxID=252190 RepID=A0AAN7BGB0_9PEZI|nr:hypothetical protein QBC38DRAFT_175641 [Podospora fimiseda]
MEPLTALGLAAAVVQFTDFGVRILTESIRVYHSLDGQTLEHVQLSRVSQDLSELAGKIQENATNLPEPGRPLRSTEQIFVRLAEQCQDISNQLNNILERLQVRRKSNSRIDLAKESIFVALRAYRSSSQISSLRESLSSIRQQMMMASLTVLWEESVLAAKNAAQLSQQQATILDVLNRIDQNTRNPRQNFVTLPQLAQAASNGSTLSEQGFVQAMWNSTWTSTDPMAEAQTLQGTTGIFGTERFKHDKFCTVSIIHSLLFEGFDHRETSIPKSYERTFGWIFRPPAEKTSWTDFTAWLGEPTSNTYWITGKAGAGKSTLMKYIIHHPNTKHQLEQWSGSLPLVTGSFYFWNAGSAMEKSLQGLLQILLFQFLCQVPHLTPKLFPRRWAFIKIFGETAVQQPNTLPSWTTDELLEAISIFTKVYIATELRLALFIDGLDEFDGKYQDLIDLVKRFESPTGAKVCVSSRPENAFTDEYRQNPSLRLHDLTRRDMETYVNGRFGANTAFLELQGASPQEADSLKSQIIDKSEGIFLWLALVVATLLEGLTEGDILDPKDLQAALDELPQDLSKLYSSIWSRIKPEYVAESSQLLQIRRAAGDSLSAVNLWLAEKQGPLDLDISRMAGSSERAYITQLMRRRLGSRTRGLLEVSSNGMVEYLHRSVWDWIKPRWDEICAKASPEFDAHLAVLIAMTINDVQVQKLNAEKEIDEDDRAPGRLHAIAFSDFRPGLYQGPNRGLKTDSEVLERLLELSRRIMSYASQVKDYERNVPILISCLDRLDLVLRSTIPSYIHQILGNDLWTERTDRRLDFQRNPKSLPLGFAYHSGPAFPMACIAAAYAVVPYVQQKVLGNRKVLEQTYPDLLSVLGYAVFGRSYIDFETPQYELFGEELTVVSINLPARYELVRFLLANGAVSSPRFYLEKNPLWTTDPYEHFIRRQWHIPRGRHYGWAVYRKLKLKQRSPDRTAEPFTGIDGVEYADYWEEVEKLFENCPEIKKWKGPMGLLPRAVNYLTRNLG